MFRVPENFVRTCRGATDKLLAEMLPRRRCSSGAKGRGGRIKRKDEAWALSCKSVGTSTEGSCPHSIGAKTRRSLV